MRYSYKRAKDILSDWANNEGFEEITFDHTDISFIDWERDSLNIPKKIKIQGKYNNETQVYIFLHELGHHQLRKSWNKFEIRLPILAYTEEHGDKKDRRKISYIVSSMEEEFKAWEEGYKLGGKLGIKINRENWDKIRCKCLMGYIRYYGQK